VAEALPSSGDATISVRVRPGTLGRGLVGVGGVTVVTREGTLVAGGVWGFMSENDSLVGVESLNPAKSVLIGAGSGGISSVGLVVHLDERLGFLPEDLKNPFPVLLFDDLAEPRSGLVFDVFCDGTGPGASLRF
jgi:hypothetical protein